MEVKLRRGLPMGVPIKSGDKIGITYTGENILFIRNVSEFPCKVSWATPSLPPMPNPIEIQPKDYFAVRFSANIDELITFTITKVETPIIDSNIYNLIAQVGKVTQVGQVGGYNLNQNQPLTIPIPNYTGFGDYFFEFQSPSPVNVSVNVKETDLTGFQLYDLKFTAQPNIKQTLYQYLDDERTLNYIMENLSPTSTTVKVFGC